MIEKKLIKITSLLCVITNWKDFYHCIVKEWLRNWEVFWLTHFFLSVMDGEEKMVMKVPASIHKDNYYTQPIPSINRRGNNHNSFSFVFATTKTTKNWLNVI